MILEVKDLEKIYPGAVFFKAVDKINMEVEKGEFIAIMGPSGSGKSTFLNVISTIDTPSSGEVFINGIEPHKLEEEELSAFRRKELGFVFQDFNLIETLTVVENIMLPMTLDNIEKEVMLKKVEELSKILGIHEILKRRTYEISGGQAQRVAIARAVINEPALLLADEPTGNLDSKAAKDVMGLFNLLNEKMNATIIMVTHDPYVAGFSKRTYIIKDGKIYQEIIRNRGLKEYRGRIMDSMALLGGGLDELI